MDTSDYNNIDSYLLGRMSVDERNTFERKIQTDMNLAKAVKEQKQAMDLLNEMYDVEMKMEVQEVQRKFLETKKAKLGIRFLKPILMAASVLLLVGVSYWLLKAPTNSQLFDDYYTAYDTGFGDRAAADPLEIKLAKASKFYKQSEFRKALPLLQSALNETDDSKVQLMTGISYLETGQNEKAIELFEQLVNEKDPAYQYHGLWYAALAHLKVGDAEKSKIKLEQLISSEDSNGVYKQKESKELFNLIKN